jgi:hypothetical protein
VRARSLLPALTAILLAAAGALRAQNGAVDASHPLGSGGTPQTVPPGGGPADGAWRGRALRLELALRIVSRENSADVWEQRAEKPIYVDQSLQLRMVGQNIVIVAIFTPLASPKGGENLVMRAVGQIWTPSEDGGLSYYSSLFAIPLRLGESAVYYPLGSKNEGQDLVEITIRVDEPAPDGR